MRFPLSFHMHLIRWHLKLSNAGLLGFNVVMVDGDLC